MPRLRTAVRSRTIIALAVAATFAFGLLALREVAKPLAFDGIPTAIAATTGNGMEMFLRIDTVQGDSADDKFKNQIVIDSYAMSSTRPAGTKRAVIQDFMMTMPMSRASGKLFAYANGGTNVPKAVLTVRNALGQEVVKWTFFDVVITSYKSVGNTHGDGITDQVSLNFGKAELEYRQAMPDGSLGEPVRNSWDQRSNKGG